VANALPDLIRARNLVRASREQLRFLLALDEGTELSLRGSLDAPGGEPPAYAEALAAARRRRPDLAELQNRRKIADEVVTITRAGTKPRLDALASGGWQRLDAGDDAAHGAVWSAGVSFTMPLFDGRRTEGLVMQAVSEAATLAETEAELLDGIAVELRRAVDAVQDAAAIVAASAGTVGQAERLLAMAEKGFEFGVKTRLDVDDAQLNLNQARGNLARARRDYLAARTACDWVTGTLGE
jgi:HAE1 family hydrophobic/amphiphilic exporter-1